MILKEKLLSHLSQLSLLTIRQHGFLPRRSTVTNLLPAEETVTRCFLTFRTSPTAQPIQTVTSVRDLGLTTGFSAGDNVARTTKKPVECFFA